MIMRQRTLVYVGTSADWRKVMIAPLIQTDDDDDGDDDDDDDDDIYYDAVFVCL